jgi:hypothetical protein
MFYILKWNLQIYLFYLIILQTCAEAASVHSTELDVTSLISVVTFLTSQILGKN